MCFVKDARLTPEYCFAYPYVAARNVSSEHDTERTNMRSGKV